MNAPAIKRALATPPDYEAADMRDAGARLRLNRNESPLPAPDHVINAMRQLNGEMLARYPVALQHEFTANLAERLGVPASNVLIGNGADDLLIALSNAFLEPGDNVITATPTFGMYARIAAMAGAGLRALPYERRWRFDAEAAVLSADARTRLVILGHPNNPTGDVLKAEDVATLSRSLPNAIIVIDEVYLALSDLSMIRCSGQTPNVVVLGSFSKVAALAGMRVGYAASNAVLSSALRRVVQPYPVGVASLTAANAYITGGAATAQFEIRLRAQVSRSLDALINGIGPFARHVWRGPANFVLMEFGSHARTIAQMLNRHGIAVRSFADSELAGALRFCATNDESTDEVIQRVRSLLQTRVVDA